jgi:hypothetical protein
MEGRNWGKRLGGGRKGEGCWWWVIGGLILLMLHQLGLPAIICCTGELCKTPLFIAFLQNIYFSPLVYDDLFHSSCTSNKSFSFLFLLPFLEAPKQGLCRKFEGSSCSGLNRRKSSCWENLNHGGLRTCLCFSPSFLYYFTFFFSLFFPFLLYVFLFYFISAFALAQSGTQKVLWTLVNL